MPAIQLLSEVEKIAKEVLGPQAVEVDRTGSFPAAGIRALKDAGVMGAAVPADLGGLGLDIAQLCEIGRILGQYCTSTAMIVAMHHIQVASLVDHLVHNENVGDYLRAVVAEKRLIASGTSEVGPSGDMRSSVCFVEPTEGGFTIEKQCTTVSYGQHAEDILFQGRRHKDASSGDQVMILATKGTFTLEQRGSWDTLGMRGTCSPGGLLKAKGESWQVFDVPCATVAAQTMVPLSHILWSGRWLGTAEDAVAKASKVVRSKAKKTPGQVPPDAHLLSRLSGKLHLMRSILKSLVDDYSSIMHGDDRGELESLSFALRENNLKLNTSELVVDIVSDAMRICGVMAYKNDSEMSLGRHLRDAYSACLMINNQRIHATNASMLLVHKNV